MLEIDKKTDMQTKKPPNRLRERRPQAASTPQRPKSHHGARKEDNPPEHHLPLTLNTEVELS